MHDARVIALRVDLALKKHRFLLLLLHHLLLANALQGIILLPQLEGLVHKKDSHGGFGNENTVVLITHTHIHIYTYKYICIYIYTYIYIYIMALPPSPVLSPIL